LISNIEISQWIRKIMDVDVVSFTVKGRRGGGRG